MGKKPESPLFINPIDHFLGTQVVPIYHFFHVIGQIMMMTFPDLEAHEDQQFPVKPLLTKMQTGGHEIMIIDADKIESCLHSRTGDLGDTVDTIGIIRVDVDIPYVFVLEHNQYSLCIINNLWDSSQHGEYAFHPKRHRSIMYILLILSSFF
jgi:hypothetical protein